MHHQWRRCRAANGLTCALTPSGEAYCRGRSYADDGTQIVRLIPTPVPGGLRFKTLSKFGNRGVTPGGEAYCWDDNFYGELGIGTYTGPEQCPAYWGGTYPAAVMRGQRVTCRSGAGAGDSTLGRDNSCGAAATDAAPASTGDWRDEVGLEGPSSGILIATPVGQPTPSRVSLRVESCRYHSACLRSFPRRANATWRWDRPGLPLRGRPRAARQRACPS